jgi:large subunit ribosomal protein L13
MTTMKPVTHTIDASGRTLGRVASEAAHALLGKRSAHFSKNEALPVKVVITNAKKLMVTEKRAKQKVYTRFTGYPGGLYFQTMKELADKKGMSEVVRKTVDGMIPRNKLRKARMKNLTVTD